MSKTVLFGEVSQRRIQNLTNISDRELRNNIKGSSNLSTLDICRGPGFGSVRCHVSAPFDFMLVFFLIW